MLTVEYAISRFRRDLTLAALVRYLLAAAALFCILVAPLLRMPIDATILLFGIGAVWLVLSFRSARSSQMASGFGSLIATGQFDRAEQQIEQSLRSFQLFRTSKLMTLHHLAMLRHAQSR